MTLQEKIAINLMASLQTSVSILYKHTIKIRTTPAGRPIPMMRASVPRTSATGLTGWVTASARDWKDTPGMATERPDGRSRIDQLPRQAVLCGWPTTRSSDGEKNTRTLDGSLREVERKGSPQDVCQAAQLAGWPTPTVGNSQGSQSFDGLSPTGKTPDGRKVAVSLNHVASFANGPARLTATGELLTGSCAGMESGGQLSPHMSRWLMGYPEVWCEAATLVETKKRGAK